MHFDLPPHARAWAVSDWHLGHSNNIGYSERPFADVDEMREVLIANHNAVVTQDDFVFVLGDVVLTVSNLWPVQQFNGRKILVAGNHETCWDGAKGGPDRHATQRTRYLDAGFEQVVTSGILTGVRLPGGRDVVLSHLPYMPEDRDAHREARLAAFRPRDEGVPLICGHVHQAWRSNVSPAGTPMINVGVDVNGYAPTSFDQLAQVLASTARG